MKRTTMALGGLLALCFVANTMAETTNVYSRNAVGYLNLDIAPGFSLLSYNWQTGTGADEISVQDLFQSVGTSLTGSDEASSADKLYIYDTNTHTYIVVWLAGDVGLPEYNWKWIDFGSEPPTVSTKTMKRGQGFWLEHNGSQTNVSIVGQVPNDGTRLRPLISGFQMVGSSYLTGRQINSLGLTNALGTGEASSSDKIYIWKPQIPGYKTLWFAGFVGDPAYDYKWIDFGSEPPFVSTEVLGDGQGAWYESLSGSPMIWTEAQPYTLN